MKPFYFLVITFLSFHSSFTQNITIPDPNFKQALIDEGIDTGGDGEISMEEARAVTSLNVSGKSISDLTGIKYFISLKYLNCTDNFLTSLDVSGLSNLEELWCYNSSLTSLELSGLSSLEGLYCSSNPLINLDVSGLSNLITLWCYDNSLTSLDVSGLNNLVGLYCPDNSLTSLNVSGLSNLEELLCKDNALVSVDLRNTPNLTYLNTRDNPDLQCLIVDDLSSLPKGLFTDENPPFTTEPCLVTFDGLEALMDGKDIHGPTAAVLSATLGLAEDGCNHGSKWKAIASLESFIFTVHRARQLGRLTSSEAELFTSNARKLIRDIRNGDVTCSGQPRNILDWFSHWFGDFYLENPAGTKDAIAFQTATHAVQRVYPNPTSGRVNFSTPVQQVVVYNMLGQSVTKAGGVDHIDMTGFKPGVYVIRLTNDNETSVQRIVKR